VSPRTVAKYRPKHLARGRGQCWTTFLRNHVSQVWACDFFTVVTLHFQTLYAFVVISLERREIVHVGVTWVSPSTRRARGSRSAWSRPSVTRKPSYLLHDRDKHL
jgi:hypothetical protein